MTYKALVAGCALVLAAGGFAAESSGRSAWIGVWNGELDGQPSVRLTLADDTGQLGGTVVFNLIKKENGQARVAGSDTHVLMHPHERAPGCRWEGRVTLRELRRRGPRSSTADKSALAPELIRAALEQRLARQCISRAVPKLEGCI